MITVLIVDDSAVARQVLTARLEGNPDITVLAAVPDPVFAMRQMNRRWPDVIVLDVEMPRTDGIAFLRQVMATRPTPVVVCSALTQRGAAATADALSAGAVSVIAKPAAGLKQFLERDGDDIAALVRAAATADGRRAAQPSADGRRTAQPSADGRRTAQPSREAAAGGRVVAIGTSTGGTQALEVVLTALPASSPAIVIAQHMPERFTAAFAERLDGMCAVEVREAADGDRVLTGRVLVAPGGRHMQLRRDGAGYRVRVFDGAPVNRHRPSVDVLFQSAAREANRNAVGIIMTGMGEDGARGLLDMHLAGARTFAQDEATCVVHGMPKAAVELGAVDREVPLGAIAEVIRSHG